MVDTRQLILEKNFESIHLNGFQGTRADKVIRELGITKGALYHYFPSKFALGYSVVDEIIAPHYIREWQFLKTYEGNPADGISQALQQMIAHATPQNIRLGCPLNNLMQEMSPLDEGFRVRLQRILNGMQQLIAEALQTGQQNHQIRSEGDASQTAFFIISAIEGCYSIAKALQSKEVFEQSMRQLIGYTQLLKME